MASRTCDSCGGAMPHRQSRQRDPEGRLVCDSCKANPQPQWTTTHGALSVVDAAEMRRREAEALTSVVRVRRAKSAGIEVTAHDSGDNAVIHHCPFCGSGGVIGTSNGTTDCEFCHTSFTVQVQPAHPFMPQTVDGQPQQMPGMPGGEETELSSSSDPTVEEAEEDVAADPLGDADPAASNGPVAPGQPPSQQPPPPPPAQPSSEEKPAEDKPKKKNLPPWLKDKKSFRTSEGHTLDPDAYMARLALEHADDREAVLDMVRLTHLQREATRDVPCPRCGGSGEVDVEPIPFDPSLAETVICPRCRGGGWLDADDPENFDLREPPHEAVRA